MTLAAIPSALDPLLCIPDLKPKRKDSALAEMVGLAHRSGSVRDPEPLLDFLLLRERLGTTAIGIARSRRGMDWNALDEQPIQLILLVLSPAESSETVHHALLARAVAVARLQRNRQKLLDAPALEIEQRMRELVS
jgi:mannitol/fructose-specific phosphotransferase system IIA component (Ntr-type)